MLNHLSEFTGETWQQRWDDSGLNDLPRPVSDLADNKYHGYDMTYGLKSLLLMRLIKPSLPAFRANNFVDYATLYRRSQQDPLLDKFFDQARQTRAGTRHQDRALFDVCCALTTQGIALTDLTPEGLLHYANEYRRHHLVGGARTGSNRFAGLLAWEILHQMGHFPPDTPPTLRSFIYKGQRTPEQMVDHYGVRDPEIRQLIIDYLLRRQNDTDYNTRDGLARAIAGRFWATIERLAPGHRSLTIPPELYDQWRTHIRLRRDGTPRVDGGQSVLLPVRAFYLDIQS